jgi:hypothetical protein
MRVFSGLWHLLCQIPGKTPPSKQRSWKRAQWKVQKSDVIGRRKAAELRARTLALLSCKNSEDLARLTTLSARVGRCQETGGPRGGNTPELDLQGNELQKDAAFVRAARNFYDEIVIKLS